jgi:hypothetical protein
VSSLVITTFGAAAVAFMMVMYAFEGRHPRYAGAWPFGAVEVIWALRCWRYAQGVG